MGKKISIILCAISVVTAGGVALFLFFRSNGEQSDSVLIASLPLADSIATTTEASRTVSDGREETRKIPEEWREYRNHKQGFSLRYPKELAVKEYDEGDGTYTIVFGEAADSTNASREEETGEKGFQIFFTPYMGDTITRSRMLKDIPSGKFTKPVEVIIGDGVRAIIFSDEGLFGEMREVWFIHNGYLYEATAYLSLDEWLSRIMSTWRFVQ